MRFSVAGWGGALAVAFLSALPAAAAVTPFTGDYSVETQINGGGPTVPAATVHNVLVNCANGQCWGTVGTAITPDQVAADFSASKYVHVLDQYVGSTKNNRYPVGVGAHVTYSFSKSSASFNDALAIVHLAVQAVGIKNVGYNHVYMIYIPKGVDVCNKKPVCVSAQNYMCGYHGAVDDTFGATKAHVLFAVIPYGDVKGCQVKGGPSEINDSMANSIVRYLADTIADPDSNGWKASTANDLALNEVGDECWQVSNVQQLVSLNRNPYKLQYLYSNTRHACADAP